MIAAVGSAVLKFLLEMLGSTVADQRALRYFGEISVAVAIVPSQPGSKFHGRLPQRFPPALTRCLL
jgi:hypothetical protein